MKTYYRGKHLTVMYRYGILDTIVVNPLADKIDFDASKHKVEFHETDIDTAEFKKVYL